VKFWREKESPFYKYKELRKEDWARFVKKCESKNFTLNSEYMQCGSDHRMNLTSTLTAPVMPENRGSGNWRLKDWPSKILRIHMTNSMNG
jgi:hypothetical protein